MKKMFSTQAIVKAALVAALYAAITIVFGFASYGPVQFRISEVLTILPLFMPESIVGLTIGCLIANFLGNGIYDIIFGTLATLVAASITYIIGRAIKDDFAQQGAASSSNMLSQLSRRSLLRFFLGALPPILINAVVVPFTFVAFMDFSEVISTYWFNFLTVMGGQAAVIIGLGFPFYYLLRRAFVSQSRVNQANPADS